MVGVKTPPFKTFKSPFVFGAKMNVWVKDKLVQFELTKSYKNKTTQQWATSHSFFFSELWAVKALIDEALEWFGEYRRNGGYNEAQDPRLASIGGPGSNIPKEEEAAAAPAFDDSDDIPF